MGQEDEGEKAHHDQRHDDEAEILLHREDLFAGRPCTRANGADQGDAAQQRGHADRAFRVFEVIAVALAARFCGNEVEAIEERQESCANGAEIDAALYGVRQVNRPWPRAEGHVRAEGDPGQDREKQKQEDEGGVERGLFFGAGCVVLVCGLPALADDKQTERDIGGQRQRDDKAPGEPA